MLLKIVSVKHLCPALIYSLVEVLHEVGYYSFLGGVSYPKSTIINLIFYFIFSFLFGFAALVSILTFNPIWFIIFLIAFYLCIKRFQTIRI